MPLFEWNDNLSVKIPSIDVQHKTLVNYINKLYDAKIAGKADSEMGPILDGLIKYTADHFKHEENFFKQFNYPEEAIHVQSHKALVGKVLDFQTKFKTGQAKIGDDLFNFLRDWLMNHILKEDKKYTAHLSSKGAK